MLTCSECLSLKGECDVSCGKTAKRAFSQTNADRIRQMSDGELAEEMSERLSEDCLMCPVLKADCPVWEHKDIECKTAMLNWLKAPVEGKE